MNPHIKKAILKKSRRIAISAIHMYQIHKEELFSLLFVGYEDEEENECLRECIERGMLLLGYSCIVGLIGDSVSVSLIQESDYHQRDAFQGHQREECDTQADDHS